MQLLVKAKVAEGFILDWRLLCLVGGRVAHVLHDHHRAFQAAQMSDVFQPVGEPVIAERHAAIRVLAASSPTGESRRGGPDRVAHEEGVGAVVEILAAEVPEMEACLFTVLVRHSQRGGFHSDAVRAVGIRPEVLTPEAAGNIPVSPIRPFPKTSTFMSGRRSSPSSTSAACGSEIFQAVRVGGRRQNLRGDFGDSRSVEREPSKGLPPDERVGQVVCGPVSKSS